MLTSARFRIARASAVTAAGALALGFSLPAAAAPAAGAASAQSAPAPAASPAASDPDRMVCVRAQITGSRLNRRICRTVREWEEDGGVPTAR